MKTGKRYWRSLGELSDTPQFREWLHREFPENASEWTNHASRRTMLRLMAASFGLAGLAACRRPTEHIFPLAKGVEDYVPGNPLFYSTAFALGSAAFGLHVETHDGRPTKIEGNPNHPASLGAASAFAQASILSLYDPDRTRSVRQGRRRSSWEAFGEFAKDYFRDDGDGLRFLSGEVISPSLEAVQQHALQRFPRARWIEYEPVSQDQAIAGAELAFGRAVRSHYQLEKADVVLALDCDFLGLDAPSLAYTRAFASRRKVSAPKSEMNRLYAVECNYSLTGAAADHRLQMRASKMALFLAALAAELKLAPEMPARAQLSDAELRWLQAVAKDLAAHRGRSLILAGPRQPAVAHAWAHALNELLGNFGTTVRFTAAEGKRQVEQIRELADEMAAGRVKTLVILGGNPAYDAPADLDFSSRLTKVRTVIRLGLEEDETSALAHWLLPEAHYLESWGDVRAWDGAVTIQQPMVAPLFGGRTAAEVAAMISGYPYQRAYDIVRNRWGGAEAAWRKALHDGLIATEQVEEVKPKTRLDRILATPLPPSVDGIEIVFQPDASVWDGRFANNGWLQEAPDPITKLTWDNAALLAPSTARTLGVKSGDMLLIESAGRQIRIPAMILPGHAAGSITLPLGYGRTKCGRVGRGVGFNVYPLRTSNAMGFAAASSVRKIPGSHRFSLTQEHHSMEGRPIVLETTMEELRKDPRAVEKKTGRHELFSLYKEPTYDQGNQWGMAIDLSACTGCNACLLACQAENNIPIVGKAQVARGREMHWIRLDRYFEGSDEEPSIVFQPMACQQCENAPCENVCPVAATSHSPEGLNDMAYNRCIGTRYCANNCPYKVRRFNFLDWHKDLDALQKNQYNPDVTVRMRGVMEKCNYCVQRIQEAKIKAKAESRRALRDGEILTACQQTCPAEAIVFGNLNDPNSKVSKLKKQARNYQVLAELNVKPRTSYLAKVRNPNPELA